METLVVATKNEGKAEQFQKLLNGLPFTVRRASEVGVTESAEENGQTFEENALKKAQFVAQRSGVLTIADDSGLCIAALDGKPGVYSSRWAGEGVSNTELIRFTLEKLAGVSDGQRQAWFISVIAFVDPRGEERTFTGRVDGKILDVPRGTAHPDLPYDSIFVPDGHRRTFAEMTLEEKQTISHRSKAAALLKEYLHSRG